MTMNNDTVSKNKRNFVDFILENEALRIQGPYRLKSGRQSPYFVNTGDFSDGVGLDELGRFYATALIEENVEFDSLYGPPDKGTALSIATAMRIGRQATKSVGYLYNRTKPKDYGDAKEDQAKRFIVGHVPQNGERVMMIDDVFTTGDTKNDAITFLKGLADVEISGLIIAVDRQEVNKDNEDAIQKFEDNTGIRVYSVADAVSIMRVLEEEENPVADEMRKYLQEWGTEKAKQLL